MYCTQALPSALVALAVVSCGSLDGSTDVAHAEQANSVGRKLLPLRGTNLAGAEFGEALPGTFGVEYTYPTTAEVDTFVAKGMTALRIPFRWPRLQRTLNGDLDATELARLDAVVTHVTAKGATAILDPHDYARYAGRLVGQDVPDSAFADFWSRLASKYAGNTRIAFGLMNEPYGLPADRWATSANAAIAAIRATGAKNLVLVPGVQWTGAHSWTSSGYGTPNAVAMLAIVDPSDNFAFEVHQYVDADFSGTHDTCAGPKVGSAAMTAFTAWLRTHGKRGFVGELGGGANPTCKAAIDDQLTYLESNSDVYIGWTWWAAGPWWGGYFLSIEPNGGVDSPMMAVLTPHLAAQAAPQRTP